MHFDEVSSDFKNLFNQDIDSGQDAKIICRGKTFKVHRNILSNRSDVFSVMLQSAMLEGQTGVITIKDMGPKLCEQFLLFLYTGKLPQLTVRSAVQLYECGDKYNVVSLKKNCVSFLADRLTKENVCTMLALADRHSDQEFREIIIQFLIKKVPQKCRHWNAFVNNHKDVAIEVLNRYCLLVHSK